MKAMLIIDMPNCCEICRFYGLSYDEDPVCLAHHLCKKLDSDEFDYDKKRPDWCPLKDFLDEDEIDE